MRVLHVVTSLDPGGMENGVCNIARGLQSRGCETHIACLERRGAFAKRLPQSENINVLGKRGGFSLRAVWALARTLRRVRPHIIHTHNLGPLIYSALATLGGRTYPILHGEHSQLAPWELEPRRLRQRHKLYRACRAIHTVSQSQLDELLSLGFPTNKLSAIANGVDTAHFSPADRTTSRSALGLPAEAIVLGLVGRFGPFKKHDVLLAAFERLAANYPQLRLVFIGAGGSEEHRIRALASASSFRERIQLLGFHADPAPLYRALDLLVIPSVNEGMSNAALEAMACAVPVLGNPGCGHEQLLTSGTDGVLADISTPELLCSAITPLLSTPQALVDMGLHARTTVELRFPLKKMLDAYEQLYRAHMRTN